MSRQSKQVVTFRATPEQCARIDQAALEAGVTRTELILRRVLDTPAPHAGSRAHAPCPTHPEAGGLLVGRDWICRHPGCTQVLRMDRPVGTGMMPPR